MSTLKADTIQSTGGGAATLTKQEATKAYCWVDSYNSPSSVITSLNVSTITDGGTGYTTLNFANAFANATYAYTGMDATSFVIGTKGGRSAAVSTNTSTTAFGIEVRDGASGTTYDSTRTCATVLGDLA